MFVAWTSGRMRGARDEVRVVRDMSRGAVVGLLVRVGGAGVALGAQVALSRALGVRMYGEYAYVASWAAVLALIGKVGMDTMVVRFGATYGGEGRNPLLAGLFRFASFVMVVSSATLVLVVGLVVELSRARFPSDLLGALRYLYFLVPFMVFSGIAEAKNRSIGRVLAALIPNTLLRPVVLLAGVLVVGRVIGQLSTPVALALLALSWATGFLVGEAALAGSRGARVRSPAPVWRTRLWLGASVRLTLVAAINVLLYQADTVMLGLMRGPETVAPYAAALRVTQVLSLGILSLNYVLAPLVSNMYAQHDSRGIQRIVTFSIRALSLVTLVGFAGLVAAGRTLLGIFGSGFVPGYWALLILGASQLVNASAGPVAALLSMTGHERALAQILGWSAAVNVVLNALLIPVLGLLGAATATAASTVLWNALCARAVWNRLGIASHPFAGRPAP